MSSIHSILLAQKGTAGAWRIEQRAANHKGLYHHGTLVVGWRNDDNGNLTYLEAGMGWGSVSDQNGINQAIGRLLPFPSPFYLSRRNGAHWERVNETPPGWEETTWFPIRKGEFTGFSLEKTS